MKQQTLAMAADQNAGYERYRKPTRREEFLACWRRPKTFEGCADLAHIAVPETRCEGAAVVAGEGALQGRLIRGRTRAAGAGTMEALGQDGLHRGQVGAGLERRLERQTQSREVDDVDLSKADAEVPACSLECFGGGECFGLVATARAGVLKPISTARAQAMPVHEVDATYAVLRWVPSSEMVLVTCEVM